MIISLSTATPLLKLKLSLPKGSGCAGVGDINLLVRRVECAPKYEPTCGPIVTPYRCGCDVPPPPPPPPAPCLWGGESHEYLIAYAPLSQVGGEVDFRFDDNLFNLPSGRYVFDLTSGDCVIQSINVDLNCMRPTVAEITAVCAAPCEDNCA